MKPSVKLGLTIILSVLTLIGKSQSGQVAIGRDTKLWLGLNLGGVYQSSDVKSVAGGGLGLTLDYYLIRNNTSLFGLGVRGQILFAASKGLGVTRDFQIQNNTALNGAGGPNYAGLAPPNNYVFQNHSTEFTDFSGNVILSLNRLRAVSRIHLYLFGGIGTTGYITEMDQLDGSGNLYDYSAIDVGFSKRLTRRNLKELLDGDYETYSEGGSSRSWSVTPTVGVGFGIQLSSRVQVGFEHKVGFTTTDLLDGNKWGSQSGNDIYHYTTLGFNIGLGRGVGESVVRNRNGYYRNPQRPTQQTVVDNTKPPVIRVLLPERSPVTLENCFATIRATIENISEKDDISVTQNGIKVDFDFFNNTVNISNVAIAGTVHFDITATNRAGSATETISFSCKLPSVEMITICHLSRGAAPRTMTIPATEWAIHATHGDTQGACPSIPAPTVTIISPTQSPITLENCSANITAIIENISDSRNISVTQNGNPVNFSFSGRTLTISNVAFTGTAIFSITATNASGSASKTVSFVCKPPVSMITICHTGANGEKQTITIPQNEWAIHAAHGDTQGACPAIPAPTVTITSPTQSPITLENCSANITAIIENISDSRNISVTQNGNPVNFSFSGRTLTISNAAFTGTANFSITATNASGSASKTVLFVCKPPVSMITICHTGANGEKQTITIPQNEWAIHATHGDTQGTCPAIPAPTVTITSPTQSPITLENCSASITAIIENISDSRNISVTQNGNPVNFSFSGRTLTISNVAFNGTAEFIITATNPNGTETKSVVFTCKPEEKKIQICHYPPGNRENPQSISISESAWPAHEAHGDVKGQCPDLTKVKEEKEKAEKEKQEKERLEKEKVERERQERERLEKEKAEKEQQEQERLEKEQAEKEKQEKERLEKEKAERERQERERLDKEKAEKEQQERERLEKEQAEKEKQEKERLEKEKAERERQERERLEKEKAEKEQQERERLEKEQAEKERLEKEKKEKAEKLKKAKEKAEAEKEKKENESEGEEMITICHIPPGNNEKPQTIRIPKSAWEAHEKHGDKLGSCND